MAILKSVVIGKDGGEPNWKEGNRIFTEFLNNAIETGLINLGEVHRNIKEKEKGRVKSI